MLKSDKITILCLLWHKTFWFNIRTASVAGQRRSVNFVTENGLYNILSQSRMEIARAWRRIVHDELINMRRTKGRNIAEQFEEWDHALDNIYFDEETGKLMQSVTVQGGDVEQIPYEEDSDGD